MKDIVVVLVNIRSLHNVGSIFRTADAAGVRKIYLTGITPEPLDRFGRYRPQCAKVSLGAEKTVPWEKIFSTRRLIAKLKDNGYKIFAVEQSKQSLPYPAVKARNFKIALVLGSEIRGLPPKILKVTDKILEIPMRGAMVRHARHPRRLGQGKESLNVSVAFGIIVYHLAFGYNRRNAIS